LRELRGALCLLTSGQRGGWGGVMRTVRRRGRRRWSMTLGQRGGGRRWGRRRWIMTLSLWLERRRRRWEVVT